MNTPTHGVRTLPGVSGPMKVTTPPRQFGATTNAVSRMLPFEKVKHLLSPKPLHRPQRPDYKKH